ncbi:hypothetical protein BO83DRAFT_377996 [Aspergillus eucalypticola CBS 122712]|uniref:Secreted protein n=1 Tax=Aspergillus eucalypticola (strain CBS 122712 / IBT 29274) TaxID=1448314 RepID=A0A317VL39_ASPEC|nr:uncharacterized protein BO83DRAFT_377996 [Aspergillus eucalypticola CBS 122712]PWY73911.1 hypothetical protein BO83DRAFT_377996 [Aspergillus eucalypticola CBS 122712]
MFNLSFLLLLSDPLIAHCCAFISRCNFSRLPRLQKDLRWGLSCYIDLIHGDPRIFQISCKSTRGLQQMFGM